MYDESSVVDVGETPGSVVASAGVSDVELSCLRSGRVMSRSNLFAGVRLAMSFLVA